MSTTNELISWLMEGDPAIRWQTMRDLKGAPAKRWHAEQRRTLKEGWGEKYLTLQAPDGSWGRAIYSPKWTSTTYTLLTLIAIGIPRDHKPAQKGAELVLAKILGAKRDEAFMTNLGGCDRCIVGMNLSLGAYFGIHDARVDAIVENLLSERMPDGGWNCRRGGRSNPHHSSFHTTFNVLEGLREWLDATPKHVFRNDVLAAEKRALEFMLEHRLYKSDKTGKLINTKFGLLTYPHRWYYNILRGLAYFARIYAPHDERLKDAMELLISRRRADGKWPVQYKYPGRSFFDMEKVGGASRWNTLRALRVLQWWEG